MDNASSAEIQQTTMILPHLHEQIPALQLKDGKLYVPVVILCNLLGINADYHIRRWSQMFLWMEAQKLPFRNPKGYQRTVWCLPLPMVPFSIGILYHLNVVNNFV